MQNNNIHHIILFVGAKCHFYKPRDQRRKNAIGPWQGGGNCAHSNAIAACSSSSGILQSVLQLLARCTFAIKAINCLQPLKPLPCWWNGFAFSSFKKLGSAVPEKRMWAGGIEIMLWHNSEFVACNEKLQPPNINSTSSCCRTSLGR